MSKKGRNTIRTPENAKKICEAVRKGVPYAFACASAGISESAFYSWKSDDEDFLEKLMAANADAVLANLEKINSDPAWQSAGWVLERRFPEHFAKREHLDVTSKGDKIDTVRVVIDEPENGDA